MANDTVVLSPELKGYGKREGFAATDIVVGSFCTYSGAGEVSSATAAVALAPKLVAVENIAVASELDYTYSSADSENVFMQSLPSGALIQAKAVAATYTSGDLLEVGANGILTALAAGIAVAIVPLSKPSTTVGVGESLVVELL